MSKFRALLVSTLLATALVGGAVSTGTATEAKAPAKNVGGSSWCC
ncbi:hypothetical protein [Nocardioides sp.]|nr:hypothetical protein [Nocardioides sp.]MDO9457037.1 hypothetical protein [Nocardioides sp.]